jgi:hypothetical protein
MPIARAADPAMGRQLGGLPLVTIVTVMLALDLRLFSASYAYFDTDFFRFQGF